MKVWGRWEADLRCFCDRSCWSVCFPLRSASSSLQEGTCVAQAALPAGRHVVVLFSCSFLLIASPTDPRRPRDCEEAWLNTNCDHPLSSMLSVLWVVYALIGRVFCRIVSTSTTPLKSSNSPTPTFWISIIPTPLTCPCSPLYALPDARLTQTLVALTEHAVLIRPQGVQAVKHSHILVLRAPEA